MMNRIMIPGVAAAALAASALFAPTATADNRRGDRTSVEAELVVSDFLSGGPELRIEVRDDDRDYRRRGGYDYGHDYRYRDDRWTRRAKRDAVRMCAAAVKDTGYNLGFRDVDIDDRNVRQVGPAGFVVVLETEFEGRRREFERDVRCEVRRGRIVALDGIPRPCKRRHGYRDYRGW